MKTWEREDILFAPKRRVQNRGSRRMPHVIGSFPSPKMQRDVEYESLGELLFYTILELDGRVVRYYVQPVHVQIPRWDNYGRLSFWKHVPDVLVFRRGSRPKLYEIKDPSFEPSNDDQVVDKCCEKFASDNGWDYAMIRPKYIPKVVQQNANFLMGFLEPRMGFDELLPEVVSRLSFMRVATIDDLSRGFQGKAHPWSVLPLIYHLIVTGTFETNVNTKITEYSEVRITSEEFGGTNFLAWEDESDYEPTKDQR